MGATRQGVLSLPPRSMNRLTEGRPAVLYQCAKSWPHDHAPLLPSTWKRRRGMLNLWRLHYNSHLARRETPTWPPSQP